jgi:hypothetical protein
MIHSPPSKRQLPNRRLPTSRTGDAEELPRELAMGMREMLDAGMEKGEAVVE